MSRKDPVTPEMRERVITRDLLFIWQQTETVSPPKGASLDELMDYIKKTTTRLGYRLRLGRQPVCVAPFIDRLAARDCSGRTTLDHIHDQMGVGKPRAKSDPGHLVSLCEGHTERGMKAGHQWNTAHRKELRDYLRKVNGR